jgi:hypothetical protein
LERLTMRYGKAAATILAVFAATIAATMLLRPG